MTRTLAFVAVSVFFASVAFAQGAAEPKTTAGGDKAPAPPDAKMMEAMQKYATPGEEHKQLKSLEGTWDAAVKFWMDPKGTPQETTGKAEFKMILGDHYLQQTFTGNMMGQPFTGQGLVAFNNASKKYETLWIDSMSTGFYGGQGTKDKEGVITVNTSMTDPMTGKVAKGRDVWKIESPTKTVFELYMPAAKTGKIYKAMEITYTKK